MNSSLANFDFCVEYNDYIIGMIRVESATEYTAVYTAVYECNHLPEDGFNPVWESNKHLVDGEMLMRVFNMIDNGEIG